MFDKDRLGRVIIPMVTPFGEDQELDYERAAELVDRIVSHEMATSILVSGTTGEFFLTSYEERIRLFEVVAEAASSRIPLVAGIGCASTRESVALGREATRLGYQTAMVVAPYFSKPTQSELYEHYKQISDALSLEILLYNIPIFTGINIAPETVRELSKLPNIVGIKEEAELNPKQLTEYALATGEGFIIYCGDDTMISEAYAQCGPERLSGIVSGGSHIASRAIQAMVRSLLDGDLTGASRIQMTLHPLLRSLGQNGRTNPVALLKGAMKLQGFSVGLPRLPYLPGTTEEIAFIREKLAAIPERFEEPT